MNHKRRFLYFVGATLIIAVAIVVVVTMLLAHPKKQISDLPIIDDRSKIIISLGECNLTVEVVNTNESRQLGLSNRTEIDSDGMLFAYDTKFPWSMWMLDMQFSIDMVFLSDNQVVDVISDIPIPANGTSEEDLDRYYARNLNYVEGNENNPNLDDSAKVKWNGDVNLILETNAGRASECKIVNGSVLHIVE